MLMFSIFFHKNHNLARYKLATETWNHVKFDRNFFMEIYTIIKLGYVLWPYP